MISQWLLSEIVGQSQQPSEIASLNKNIKKSYLHVISTNVPSSHVWCGADLQYKYSRSQNAIAMPVLYTSKQS